MLKIDKQFATMYDVLYYVKEFCDLHNCNKLLVNGVNVNYTKTDMIFEFSSGVKMYFEFKNGKFYDVTKK